MDKKVNKEKTTWYESQDWDYRKNTKRKQSGQDSHPSLVVGENDNTYANLGLTHADKRGHHKNIELSENPNPNDKKKAFVRNDLQFDDKRHLKEKLKSYKKLSEKDIDKIYKIINKKR